VFRSLKMQTTITTAAINPKIIHRCGRENTY
jgi:hypothetical protein